MNSRQNRGRIPDEEETRKWQKIPFRIVQVSSQDEEYNVRELLSHTPFSRGWLSSRFCDYPQQLLIEFPKPIKMREIQFLSHQYSIATKIEIFILPPQSEKFKKIGYLSLDSNERSNFQARELKTVYTDYLCVRVKFNLLRCHNNSHNIYNQVGLIAISVLGEYPNVIGNIIENNMNLENLDKLEDEMIYDPATLKRLKELYKAKKKAVELEDFDEAKRIKVAIDSLKSVSQSLIQLEERKKIAIKNDDFDAAKLIKYEIERLRAAVAGSNLKETNRKILQEQYNNNNKINPLELPPGYPNSGDKTLLFNTQNQKDYQPINNEYEMENDEDIYRIRNNINQGYQLEDPEKLNRAMELDNNAHSVFLLYYHLVLVVKYRRKVFDDNISDRAKEIFEYISPNYNITLQEWNHDVDHVHLLFKAHPKSEISKFINAYKSASSRLNYGKSIFGVRVFVC